jgi:hypothetical protein
VEKFCRMLDASTFAEAAADERFRILADVEKKRFFAGSQALFICTYPEKA